MELQIADAARWRALHSDAAARAGMKNRVREGWERCLEAGLDPETARPAPVNEEEFKRIKAGTKRLYVYAGSIIVPMELHKVNERAGVLLFDKTGCLMRSYGGEALMNWLAENHIEVGERWSEEALGVNAVSLGLQTERTYALNGADNYSRMLTVGNFTYAPIKLENGDLFGGVVVATPRDVHLDSVAALAVLLARGIELQLFWFETVFAFSSITEGSGLVCLDQSNEENRILLISEETVRMLGLPKRDYFYDKLETVIDDGPANKRFWDLVNKKAEVQDMTIPLMVRGKEVVVSVTSAPYKEKKFHMHGMSIQFNSLKRINKLVSRYSGNTARYTFDDIIGRSEAMQEVVRRAKTASFNDSNILLSGESGVGKDIFAQAIHNNSRRKNQPFVAINCAAFSKELIASELFGYESGAFTGARKEGAIGKFELANNGTLFLDEIGDMPLDLQAILLRVLEEKSLRRVGGNTLIEVNVRIIAASNKNLLESVESGLFREDLFYRLGVIRINIPPLRNRLEDIPALSQHFVHQICARLGKPEAVVSDSALRSFRQSAWPGNIRELQNLLEGVLSTGNEPTITEREIDRYLEDFSRKPEGGPDALNGPEAGRAQGAYLYDERLEFVQALKLYNNNKTKAAQHLGIPLRTFYRRLKKYNMM